MNIRTERDLGLVIRERRRQLGLDQSTLAARADVSRQWIVEVEKGKPRAEVGLILRTLRVLGVELRAEDPGPPSNDDVPPVALVDIDSIIDRVRESEDES